MRLLLCKVLEKTNEEFRLYSSSDVSNTTFNHTDLHEMMNIRFEQLQTSTPRPWEM